MVTSSSSARRRGSIFRTVVVIATLSGLVAIASPASGVTRTAPGAWKTSGLSMPVAAGWQSVTCPTSTTCIGAAYTQTGFSILERSTNAGASFQYMKSPNLPGSDVACASQSFCVLASAYNEPGEPATTYTTANGGTTWTHVALPSAATTSYTIGVGCSTTVCYFVGTGSSTTHLLSITAPARAWTVVTLPSAPDTVGYLNAVACGGGRCVAVGSNAGFTSGLIFESDGGSWSETVAPTISGPIDYVAAVGCSAYACAAYGEDSGAGELFSSTASGTWQPLTATASYVGVRSISCTASNCVAVGGNFDVGGLATWSLSGGTPAWTTLTTPTGEGGQVFTAVACPSASACVAGTNRLYDLSVSHGTWSAPDVGDGTSAFAGISCASRTTCVGSVQLGDGRVATRTTTDGGVRWAHVVPIQASDGFPYGLACTGSTCMIDGYDEATNSGWLARSTHAGQRWKLLSEPNFGPYTLLTSLSCATSLICTAALYQDGLSELARTTNGGASWFEITPKATGPTEKFGVSVDCMSAQLCVAVLATSIGVERLISHTGGATWSYGLATTLKLNFDSLSCVPQGVCQIAGTSGRQNVPVVLRSVNGGSSWTRVGAPHNPYGASLQTNAISCWTSTDCEIAYDGVASTRFFVTTNAGGAWTAVPSPRGAVVSAIRCSELSCIGLGSSGVQPLTAVEPNP